MKASPGSVAFSGGSDFHSLVGFGNTFFYFLHTLSNSEVTFNGFLFYFLQNIFKDYMRRSVLLSNI